MGQTAYAEIGSDDLIRDKDVKETNRENRKLGKDDGSPCALDHVDTLELEGYTPNYAVFGQEDWEYTCGARKRRAHADGVETRHCQSEAV